MEEYISKSALVAELKRLQDALQDPAMKRESMQDYAHGGNKIVNEIRSFLNTLKTKDVDLEKEIKDYFDSQPIITRSKGLDYRLIPTGVDIAKHFYELGLKAQKGE